MTIKQLIEKNFCNFSTCYFDEYGSEQSEYNKNEEGVEEFITIPYTGSGDYMGSAIEKANRKELTELFESSEEEGFYENECWVTRSLSYCYQELAIKADLPVDKVPSEIVSAIEGLSNYPVIDDESVYEVEQEVIKENWEHWAESDLKSSAEKAALEILECEDIRFENALCAYLSTHGMDYYYKYCEMNEDYPTTESAESAHFPGLETCGELLGQYFAKTIVWC